MILIFRLLFILFFFHEIVFARPWPWIIVWPSSLFLSSSHKKLRSCITILKKEKEECSNRLFPYKINAKVDHQCYSLEEVCYKAREKRSLIVKVLLAECDAASQVAWNFTSKEGFMVQAIKDDGKKSKAIKVSDVSLIVSNGSLYYKGKKLQHGLYVYPLAAHGELNGVSYDGYFCIIPYKNSYLCINKVGLEDYVTAVLKTESWPGWPLEVNKVFAIACRSYGAYKVLEAKRSKKPFDVKNSNVHQTYKGRHDLPVLKQAVEQTRSIVLGFKGEPILAMFDCCCGGIIPAHIADFDFQKAPYLARLYACNYCKESSLYSWQVSYDYAVFNIFLKQYNHHIVPLRAIYITKKDKAGLVVEVKCNGPKASYMLSGKKLYSMLKEVKSFSFDVCKKAGKVVFMGRGFGHHLGLCQWGARQMVREKFDYKSILRFYYPGTFFMRLR